MIPSAEELQIAKDLLYWVFFAFPAYWAILGAILLIELGPLAMSRIMSVFEDHDDIQEMETYIWTEASLDFDYYPEGTRNHYDFD